MKLFQFDKKVLDNDDIIIIIFGVIMIALLIFLSHDAKVKCEKSGGFLVRESIGKSYRIECVK